MKQTLKRIALRSAAKVLSLGPVRYLTAKPTVRSAITRSLRRFPRLDAKLRDLARRQPHTMATPLSEASRGPVVDVPAPLMSRAARQAQFSLARAIRK